MCGADAFAAILPAMTAGSSPRVRSRRVSEVIVDSAVGIISACAEQTMAATLVP